MEMTREGIPTGTRVELYARTSLPDVAKKRRDQIVARLDELATAGHVSTVEIHNWTKKVPLGGESREHRLYERFEEWATEVGVDLAPFFDTRTCYGMASGEKGDRLVVPVLCLAVYREGRLQSVYPHSTNDGARSVMDCLRAIESAHRHAPGNTIDSETANEDLLEPST